MDAELIAELREYYRLLLQTDKGKRMLKEAIKSKQNWAKIKSSTQIQVTTSGVNLEKLNTKLASKCSKLTIIPIGLNNYCHYNAEYLGEMLETNPVLGFNITACPCGGRMCFEIHSVNKFEGVLYDFTRDFADETEKYFLELNDNMDASMYNRVFGSDPIVYTNNCTCNINWTNSNKYNHTEDQLLRKINRIETVKCICL